MHTNLATPDSARGKVRHDQGNVPDTGDHRIGLVNGALPDRSTGMCVDIGNDSETLRLTDCPQLAEGVTLNFDVPAQTRWVQVIEVLDMSDAA